MNRREFSARELLVVASFLVPFLVPIRVVADEPIASLSVPARPISAVPVYDVTIINDSPTGLRLSQSGDVAGWTTVGGPTQPILYTPENGVIVLPTSTGQPYGIARDLSERSAGIITVVGEARLNPTDLAIHAVRWRVAVPKGIVTDVTDLGVLDGHSESFARGVNSAGQIVGNSDPNSFLGLRSFLYSDSGGMVDLGLGSIGQNAVAQDLNDSGVVTGYLGLQAFRWSAAGGFESLGAPPGWAYSFGYAINASGQVAGTASAGNAEVVARYTDVTGWKILGGTGQHNLGHGINQWGDVVGTAGGEVSVGRGLIYTDPLGLLAFLDDLLLVPGSWRIMEAYDINDAQQVTGWAINTKTGLGSAVLLTPVNPPPPNQPPVASFTYSCNALLYCGFDGSGSTDDRGVLSWAWTANGKTIGLLPAKFIGVQFSAPQTIDVTLTVTDARGATNAITKAVVVGKSNGPPAASFTSNCNDSTRVCSFNGTGSTDEAGIVSYGWAFGDGAMGSGATPSHTYAATGSYPVTLTVADGSGLTNSLTATVTLASVKNQPPVPTFTVTCQSAPAHVCTFDGSGSRDPDGTIAAFKWTDQGNQTLSTAVTFTRTFQRRGIKGKYILAVTDDGGLTRSITKSFIVP